MSTPSELTCRSYAKINLYLDVLERRPDGYHDIETIFQTVDLADSLTFSATSSGITLDCSDPGLETGPGNLVYRAAMLLLERTGHSHGAAIHLTKNIPIAAGLAGGSGNAAATLAALNRLWGLGLSAETLSVLALDIGSDVPYCMNGGTMAATGRGETLSPLEDLRETWFVLVHPPLHVSAADVYGSALLQRNSAPRPSGRTAGFQCALDALRAGDWPKVVFNAMEKPVFAVHPELERVKMGLLEAGCCAAAMSGSGPTLFGVAESQTHAAKTAREMPGFRTSVVSCAPMGLALTP